MKNTSNQSSSPQEFYTKDDFYMVVAFFIPAVFYVVNMAKMMVLNLGAWSFYRNTVLDGSLTYPEHVGEFCMTWETYIMLSFCLLYLIFGKGIAKRLAVLGIYFFVLMFVAGFMWGFGGQN